MSRVRLLAVAVALAACRAGDPAAPRPPDLLLVVLDTVRADRLSSYGYGRPTSPHLDALAARGIRFANATSTSSWTLPAHASLFTGLYPIAHGATQEHTRLEEGPATLAEALSARGYQTFAASGNPLVNRQSGLARGFDAFAETWRGAAGHPNLEALLGFLERRDADRPFFAFVNFFEAHAPYDPPEPYRSRFVAPDADGLARRAAQRPTAEYYLAPAGIPAAERGALGDLYDAAIAHVDALLGAFLADLEARGALDRAFVFVTSDHGEHLGERGHYRHVFSLYGGAVRIPLIARLPGDRRAGEVVGQPVGLVDLHATILARGGGAAASPGAGRDLLGPLAPGDPTPLFAEYYYPLQALRAFPPGARDERGPLAPHLRRLRSVERGGLRLIWSSDARHELFDVRADPAELRDLSGAPELAAREAELHALLREFAGAPGDEAPLPAPSLADAPPSGALGDLDREAAARLRALGYLRQGDPTGPPGPRGVE